MQRLLREIFCIAFIITSTLIYGNLITLLINKIIKELPPQKNTTTTTTIPPYNFNSKLNIKIHYPTMMILLDDQINDNNNVLF